jgi:ADP-heptose:LPS heptosyltransferase
MQVSSKLNDFRRAAMHRITRNIGTSNIDSNFTIADKAEIKKILVCRPNHRLGNLLLVTPLLDEIADIFPDAQIDLFVKGTAAHDIFRNYQNVRRIIDLPRKPFLQPFSYIGGWLELKLHNYDIVINVDKKSSSGRLSTKWANARYRFFGDDEPQNEKHIAKKAVYHLRAGLRKLGLIQAEKKIPQLDLKLSWLELTRGKKKLQELVGNDKKTISLFTYATGNKCYSAVWWNMFYHKLKVKYRDYNIIEILPVEKISKLNFNVPTFYSKDIREIGAVIANTEVFIGADSGIMHLASAVGTPTLGLFSVTDESKYEPYNPRSLAINTVKKGRKACFHALNAILRQGRIGAA